MRRDKIRELREPWNDTAMELGNAVLTTNAVPPFGTTEEGLVDLATWCHSWCHESVVAVVS